MGVNDLDVGKEYEFRVFAVNEIGESEALKTNKPMLAKEKYTVSLSPGQPTVLERVTTLRPRIILSKATFTSYSLAESRADVASSRSKRPGCLIIALAMATLCFCPPLSITPLSPTRVS